MILGHNSKNSILNEKNEIKSFTNYKKFYVLIVKPNFGCSTREIYSKVKKFNKPKFNKPNKKMFNLDYLRKMSNSLEIIALSKYTKLRVIKLFLENLSTPVFVRMTGSGSAIVAYFLSKERCDNAKKQFARKCSVCHTLVKNGKKRAGPTLYKIFGREAGTLKGYKYSKALLKSDIIWNEETINRLFDEGPDKVTPGTTDLTIIASFIFFDTNLTVSGSECQMTTREMPCSRASSCFNLSRLFEALKSKAEP